VVRGAAVCRNASSRESQTIRDMTIRHFQNRRAPGWLAIFAMLLLALVPTVSRVVGLHAPAHHHEVVQAGHDGHAGHHGGPGGNAGDGDDCWSKCGYCDFLAHAPVLGALVYPIALHGLHPSIPPPSPLRQPRLAIAFPAAQPRGPPVLA
jgi:hypothetical protein